MLVFLVSNPIYDIYIHLSKMNKYSKYMTDVEKFISPYHYEEKPLEIFTSTLKHVGLKVSHIEIREQIFIYDNVDLLKCKARREFLFGMIKINFSPSSIDRFS